MRNWKKFVAAFAAATMIMSVGSVAFATAVPTVNEDHNAVSLTNYTEVVDSSYQWTVIIIPAAKKTATSLEASDLLYINQGKSTDGFWTNMGTKGESLADGNYTMRIGGNSPALDSLNPRYYEFDFTVSSDDDDVTITFTWGDFNADGNVDSTDVTNAIVSFLGGGQSFVGTNGYTFTRNSGDIVKDAKTYTMEKGYLWGDINGDGDVDSTDVTNTIVAFLGGNKSFTSSVLGETYTYGASEVTLKVTEK